MAAVIYLLLFSLLALALIAQVRGTLGQTLAELAS